MLPPCEIGSGSIGEDFIREQQLVSDLTDIFSFLGTWNPLSQNVLLNPTRTSKSPFLKHGSSTFQPNHDLETLVSEIKSSSLSQKRSDTLENSLSRFLPSYMVPSLFLVLEQVPFSASGKFNRKLLREAIATIDITSLGPKRCEISHLWNFKHSPPQLQFFVGAGPRHSGYPSRT